MTFQWFSAAAERKREEEEVKMLPKFVSFAERQSPIVLSLRVKHAVFRSFSGIPRRTLKAAKKGNSTELLLLPLARVAFTTERGCDGKLFPFTDFGYSINIHIESQALAALRLGPKFGVHVLQRPRSRPTRPVRSHQPNTIHLLPSYYRFVLRLLAFSRGLPSAPCG